MSEPTPQRPWLRHYGDVPHHLIYPERTLYEMVAASAARAPDAVALDFYDRRIGYRELLARIHVCADGLAALGVRSGARVLIVLPNVPQAVVAFYAANKVGAVPAFVHPLSAPPEIEHALDATGADVVVTLEELYPAVAAARPKRAIRRIVLARAADELPRTKRAVHWLRRGRHAPALPSDPRVLAWRDLCDGSQPIVAADDRRPDDPAAILFSGGTTALPKGIVLSNRNFVAQGTMAAAWGGIRAGGSILAILPVFHGFGLGVCVNAALMAGATSILVPRFDAAEVAKLLVKKRPTFLVGVPTLYAALAADPRLKRADLSFLRAAFCGADALPRPVKERFEKLVGGRFRMLEGYGLTEAVTGVLAMPLDGYREGTIGVPFPDMDAKICAPGTSDEVADGGEGEICIAGPAVMLGYLDDPDATAHALKRHRDGRIWLHTGDLGHRDADGYFHFHVRLKRMIKSSGFNVYPAQVEAVLLKHPLVSEACVVGVPDAEQVERVVACVVPASEPAGEGEAHTLIAHCRENLIKWSCPREIRFCASLPKTRVGKIDYRVVQREAERA